MNNHWGGINDANVIDYGKEQMWKKKGSLNYTKPNKELGQKKPSQWITLSHVNWIMDNYEVSQKGMMTLKCNENCTT
jgi:hypothetical protein